jgi:hypothetical protein
LPDPTVSRETEHWVWLEGVPAEIPTFGGERVVLLQGPVMKREVSVEVPYDALFPSLKPKGKVSAAEVDRLLAKMAKAAAKLRPVGKKAARTTSTPKLPKKPTKVAPKAKSKATLRKR